MLALEIWGFQFNGGSSTFKDVIKKFEEKMPHSLTQTFGQGLNYKLL